MMYRARRWVLGLALEMGWGLRAFAEILHEIGLSVRAQRRTYNEEMEDDEN